MPGVNVRRGADLLDPDISWGIWRARASRVRLTSWAPFPLLVPRTSSPLGPEARRSALSSL